MKFYYEGQLIRTSKNHHYSHACLVKTDDGYKCMGCSSSREGAEKIKQEQIRRLERYIENCKSSIKAIEDGEKTFRNQKNEKVRIFFSTAEEAYEAIQKAQSNIRFYEENWIIVKLEEREA